MEVKELQHLLRQSGIMLKEDGIIADKTIDAIKSFQVLHGLTVDGKLSKELITRLQTYSNVDISGVKYVEEETKVVPMIVIAKETPTLKAITDKPTLDKIFKLHPIAKERTVRAVQKANARLTGSAQMRIVQGLRTFAEQDALYVKRPKVTNAKGGQSIHNYGVAIDFALLINGKEISWESTIDYDGDKKADWMEVVEAFKEEGFKWGGDWKTFKDLPHLELYSDWRALLVKHNNKDFIPGTTYVNI